MHKYVYDGPVMIFDHCVLDRWKGETVAVSERKARTNLAYQYKKNNNYVAGAKVELPGKITMVS